MQAERHSCRREALPRTASTSAVWGGCEASAALPSRRLAELGPTRRALLRFGAADPHFDRTAVAAVVAVVAVTEVVMEVVMGVVMLADEKVVGSARVRRGLWGRQWWQWWQWQ